MVELASREVALTLHEVAARERALFDRELRTHFGVAAAPAGTCSPFRSEAVHLVAHACVLSFRWVTEVEVAWCILKAYFPGELVVLGQLVGKRLGSAIDDREKEGRPDGLVEREGEVGGAKVKVDDASGASVA